MKNLIQKSIIGLVASISLFSALAPTVAAADVATKPTATQNNNIKQDSLTDFDKYVVVKDNQFVLNLPQNNKFSSQRIANAKSTILDSNRIIQENNLTIDTQTKTAVKLVSTANPLTRGYGKNAILAVRWNSIRIGLDKGLVNDILHAGVAAGAGYIGFLVGGPYAAGAVAAASVIVDRHLDTKSGWWFDYNFYTRTITGFGRQ